MRRTTTRGRIERGFGFLGYHFSRVGLTVAKKTIANFIEKASRLYEQERRVLPVTALEMYVKRWLRWTTSGRITLLVQSMGHAGVVASLGRLVL